MFNEVVRIPAAWWQDPVYGVNAKLATVPRGADPLPTSVSFADETTNGEVARGFLPENIRPILTTEIYRWVRIMPHVEQGVLRDAQVQLLVRYGDQEAQSQVGKRDAHYVMRALLMSVAELMQDTNAAARILNSVMLYALVDITPATIYAPEADRDITGGILLTFDIRDIQPY